MSNEIEMKQNNFEDQTNFVLIHSHKQNIAFIPDKKIKHINMFNNNICQHIKFKIICQHLMILQNIKFYFKIFHI